MTHVLDERPMLTGHAHARTNVVAEAEESVARSLTVHRLVDVSGELDLIHNMAWIGRVSLHYIDYGAELAILPKQSFEPYYLVQIPLRGSMWLTSGSTRHEAGTGSAIITEPGRATSVLQYSEHCARLLVKIPSLQLRRRQAQYPGSVRDGAVFSSPILDLDTGRGRSWANLLQSAVVDLETGTGLLSHPHADAFFEHMLIDGLLLTREPNPSALEPVSRVVRHALRYIDANLAQPISVDDVARAAHLSTRALQDRFRKELGLSPMAFVRDRRLEAVHRELASGRHESVGRVAAAHGVTHLGRFAAVYRQRFGESPSDTIRGMRSSSQEN